MMVFTSSVTQLLYQLPVLPAAYPLKVAADAPQHVRLQANAAMLGALRFNGEVIRECQQNMGMASRLHRTLMQLSGYAIRITEIFQAADDVTAKFAKPDQQLETENSVVYHTTPIGTGSSDDCVVVEDVDVCTPSGVRLISGLRLRVEPGAHTLIWGAHAAACSCCVQLLCGTTMNSVVSSGPSGIGKTSIFRCLNGMWSSSGALFAPRSTIFVPSRPHFPQGSLQDQVTYPHRLAPGAVPIERLRSVIQDAGLWHILERYLDVLAVTADWNSQLSLSEKQQLALARVMMQVCTFQFFANPVRCRQLLFTRAYFGPTDTEICGARRVHERAGSGARARVAAATAGSWHHIDHSEPPR
jgi:ABC-type uncharacterized transport system fused permease/ATPase subunit